MKFRAALLQPLIVFFFLLLTLLLSSSATPKTRNSLTRGSSLSVEDDTKVLVSPDQTFTCGFYGSGENAYWFSIWFTNSKDKTVVWMANRDKPVNGKGSTLSLRGDGALVLADVDGSIVWMSNTSSTVVWKAELLDTGNLVLRAPGGKILWQSFDSPTDTLLPHQLFTKGTTLVSVLGRGNFGSGFFNFLFDTNNVLTLLYSGSEISSIYWPNPDFQIYQNGRYNYNSSRIAVLDDFGRFEASDRLQFSATDAGSRIKRRLTLDYDGNLRLYSFVNETGLWVVSWEAMRQLCSVHGICGRNGICVYTPEPKCSCPPGYEVSDSEDWSKGCKPNFELTCSSAHKFVEVKHTDFYGFDLNYTIPVTMKDCMKLCSDDCRCQGFSYRFFGTGVCYTKSALFNGYQSTNFPGYIFLKLPANMDTSGFVTLAGSDSSCSTNGSQVVIESSTYDSSKKNMKWAYFYWFAGSMGVIEVLLGVTIWWFLFGKNSVPDSVEHGYRVISSQFKQFSYSELKKATNKFKKELGRGASGSVYKGILPDEREVAVKKLGEVYQEEDMFWAEVNTIGKIYHMNLVRMWGFCLEGKHRLLVYEYLDNSSLDKHIFSDTAFLGWKERFKVVVGTAKGLAYLHHECLEWVIHCDVKPENILLDNDFEAKIADFGLAKLTQRGSNTSEFTRIRGTKGYMAPEWALNLPITAKVDVYSFGVVALELVKGYRMSNLVIGDDGEEESELTRFVRTVKGRIRNGDNYWVEESVDPRLQGKFDRNQAAKVIELGPTRSWCSGARGCTWKGEPRFDPPQRRWERFKTLTPGPASNRNSRPVEKKAHNGLGRIPGYSPKKKSSSLV